MKKLRLKIEYEDDNKNIFHQPIAGGLPTSGPCKDWIEMKGNEWEGLYTMAQFNILITLLNGDLKKFAEESETKVFKKI